MKYYDLLWGLLDAFMPIIVYGSILLALALIVIAFLLLFLVIACLFRAAVAVFTGSKTLSQNSQGSDHELPEL